MLCPFLTKTFLAFFSVSWIDDFLEKNGTTDYVGLSEGVFEWISAFQKEAHSL